MPIGIAGTDLATDINLQAIYQCEDITDSKNSNDLTNNNSVTFTVAKFLNGANFGATNSDKSLSTTSTLSIDGGACAFSIWVKILAEPTGGAQFFLTDQVNNGNNVQFALRYSESGGTETLKFLRVRMGITSEEATSDVTLGTSVIHHIVGAYDTTNLRLYLDDSLLDTTASSGNGSITRTQGFAIGGTTNADNFASALIDDGGMFNRNVSAAEVTTLFNSPLTEGIASMRQLVGVGQGTR